MAEENERMALLLEANLKAFERAMDQADKRADRTAQRIEARFNRMNADVARQFDRLGDDVRNVLATLGVAALGRDVTQLGDEWIRIGNLLAIAGVNARDLADAQQIVADIAIRTRTNLESTADLFARMFKSSKDLGASFNDVARVTELTNKALAGAAPSERAGAVVQLGQGLGSGKLQGDELRSILENSRVLSEAIAREFNTTVGNLRTLGKQGELESRRVFQAIINAAPEIESAFARTRSTVADAFTNLETQAARYVGTNQKLANSQQAFIGLIQFTAQNFETLANAAIVAATVVGGTFAGIAMARALGALGQFIVGLETAEARAAALKGALSFFGGPLGIGLAVAGAGMAFLATQTDLFASKANAIERADDSLYSALLLIQRLEPAAGASAAATGDLASNAQTASRELDGLAASAGDVGDHLDDAAQNARDLAEAEKERAIATLNAAIADREAIISLERRDRLLRQIAGAVDSERAEIRRGLGLPSDEELNQRGEEAIRAAEQRIERLRGIIARLQSGALVAPSPESAGAGGNTNTNTNIGRGGPTVEELEAQAALTLARLRHETQTAQQLDDELDILKRTDAYESRGLSHAAARAEAEREVAAERAASNAEARRSIELAQLQDQADLARARGLVAVSNSLRDEVEIRQRIAAAIDHGVDPEKAKNDAVAFVRAMRDAEDATNRQALAMRALQNDIDLAQAIRDDRATQAAQRRLEIEQRIEDLKSHGVDADAAASQAEREVAALEQADLQGKFRNWFTGGVKAALSDDLGDFFQNWLSDRAEAGLTNALNDLADVLWRQFSGTLTSVMQGGDKGITSAIGAIFGGQGEGVSKLNDAAATAADSLKGQLATAAATAAAQEGIKSAAIEASAAQETTAAASKASSAEFAASANIILAKSAIAAAKALQSVAASSSGNSNSGLYASIIGSIIGGARAGGGPMSANKAYLTGERGPEWVIPNTPSYVVPHGMWGGSSNQIVYSPTYNFQGTGEELALFRAEAERRERMFDARVVASVRNASGRRQFRGG